MPQLGKGNKLSVLEGLQDGQGLVLEPDAKTSRQLTDPADPLAGVNSISDAIQPAVRGSEVGVGAEDGIIKEALNKSTCADLRQKFLLTRKKIAGILTDFKIF